MIFFFAPRPRPSAVARRHTDGDLPIISPTIISEKPLTCLKIPCQRGEVQGLLMRFLCFVEIIYVC